MGYRKNGRWRPSKTEAREFAKKMQEDSEFREAYHERQREKAERRRAQSDFDYESAGGQYVPTEIQWQIAGKMLETDGLTNDQQHSANMVFSAFSLNEKTHHDNIHRVNEWARINSDKL